MTDDAELLRRYAEEDSQEAFAELVQRHLGLVFHAALRQCGGDAHRAEDVAQLVFTDLARKAAALARRPVLAGWLYTSTHYAAAQTVRTEVRRQQREGEAAMMEQLLGDPQPPADWARLRPVIDEALQALGETDREAVLLRFFEGRPFAEIGLRLAVSEDAARMRVERALEKMRAGLARHGMTSTIAALGAALATQATAAAPAGLAASITGAALGGAGVATTAIVFMTMTKLQVGLAVAVAAIGTAGLLWQHEANARLRAEVARLQPAVAENARLRVENERLVKQSGAAGNLPAALAPAGVVAASSGHVPDPRAAKPYAGVPLAAGLSPVESLGNVGRTTPRAAFSTQLWAARTGNSELEATAITFGPEARAKLVALAAQLPASVADEYNTPEKLMAFILAGSHHPVGGMQVLGETVQDNDNVTLQTQWQHLDDDIVHQSDVQMHREADGWKMVVPVVLVDRAAAYLTRNTPGK